MCHYPGQYYTTSTYQRQQPVANEKSSNPNTYWTLSFLLNNVRTRLSLCCYINEGTYHMDFMDKIQEVLKPWGAIAKCVFVSTKDETFDSTNGIRAGFLVSPTFEVKNQRDYESLVSMLDPTSDIFNPHRGIEGTIYLDSKAMEESYGDKDSGYATSEASSANGGE